MMQVLSVSQICGLLFSKLGFWISKYPKIFILMSVICTVTLSAGILRVNYRNDFENLFAIKDGPVFQEAATIRQLFPDNSTKFSLTREVRPGKFARLIIQRRDGDSILDLETWAELMKVDRLVQNVSIKWKDEVFQYEQLCSSFNGECYRNNHLDLWSLLPQILNGSLRLSYPVMFDPINFHVYPLNLFFGGFTFRNGSTTVESIKTISMDYFVRNDTIDDDKRSYDWESAVMEQLEKLNNKEGPLKIDYITFHSFDDEAEKNTLKDLPFLIVSSALTLLFAICTSFTGNWVTSKPWLALMGIFACMLGICSAFGFLALIGVSLISINAAVPFIALGVGIDDTFVMMAAWWRTSRSDSVSQRMMDCYRDAGVSITVTTLTDVLSFYVGIWSDIPCIKIFCAYAGTAVFFIYIFQIFCFGACMAISGQLEEQNRHSLFPWKKVKNNDSLSTKKKTEVGNLAMEFFRDSFAPFVSKPYTKVISVIIYVAYISISVVGVVNMKQGLENKNIGHWDSYMSSYYNTFDKYFREYPVRSQVVISTPLDYSKKDVQEMVGNYMYNLTHLDGLTPEYAENWLTDFLRFANNYGEFYNFTIDTEQDFIDVLRNHFLHDDSIYSRDVKFNNNHTKIVASRFIVQHYKVKDAQAEKDLLVSVRALAASETSMNVTTYNIFNMLTDPAVALVGMTITLVGMASLVVMAVTIIFMPNVLVCVFTLLSIASVQLGVVGFISLFGVNLDSVSVIALIMCIGFSVDFPAHLMYAYVKSKKEDAQARIDEAIYALAWPIVQAAVSTVIAASGLYFSNSYVFQVLLKIIGLVMLFSTFNTLFILPLLVVLFSGINTCSRSKKYSLSSQI